MANIAPNVLFPNMTSNGTDITIPIADLAGLTAVEANPSTGDGRELLRVILESALSRINALPTADKPTKVTITKPNPQGIAVNTIRQSYTVAFDVNFDSSGVAMVSES